MDFKKLGVKFGLDLTGSGYDPVAGFYEHNNKP
jgi:hypothetical protein